MEAKSVKSKSEAKPKKRAPSAWNKFMETHYHDKVYSSEPPKNRMKLIAKLCHDTKNNEAKAKLKAHKSKNKD